jgi:hypothetical protein
VSEEVDLIVVEDHKRSEKIVEALKHAGIHHIEFWPEGMLFSNAWGPRRGPFHIRVREERPCSGATCADRQRTDVRPTLGSAATHLFGDTTGPHMAQFHARHENGCIELDWEVRRLVPPLLEAQHVNQVQPRQVG